MSSHTMTVLKSPTASLPFRKKVVNVSSVRSFLYIKVSVEPFELVSDDFKIITFSSCLTGKPQKETRLSRAWPSTHFEVWTYFFLHLKNKKESQLWMVGGNSGDVFVVPNNVTIKGLLILPNHFYFPGRGRCVIGYKHLYLLSQGQYSTCLQGHNSLTQGCRVFFLV